MRPEDLLDRLHDQPFQSFRIHLSDGSAIDVPEPAMVIVGRSTAVLPSRFGKDAEGRRSAEHWRTVALIHVVQFSNLNESRNGRRRKK